MQGKYQDKLCRGKIKVYRKLSIITFFPHFLSTLHPTSLPRDGPPRYVYFLNIIFAVWVLKMFLFSFVENASVFVKK